ncbi:GreA/GreB family elongation factor [Flavihumibacter solisilvae]|uniref:Transcription elongation factor GreA/GreB C-terminal domain-containing protein n=1 Tax=Flavihumibacter solisilvae TaxID=1349421 RepID=A0A0C1ISE9_9BACT|nr:GreA/GreB family elongation factor [Flavihumibacter solisilvae]KIC93379.1 hypothetical protein OI18_16480 [Flavihumibacter solisilvae]
MDAQINKLILLKSDYDLLLKYIYSRMSPMSGESKHAEQLYDELNNAEIIEKEDRFPADVIRLNSNIEVIEEDTGRRIHFRLVLPTQANLSKGKLSVFAPLGIALIGYRKGQHVAWEMPAGKKVFYIADVTNEGLLV